MWGFGVLGISLKQSDDSSCPCPSFLTFFLKQRSAHCRGHLSHALAGRLTTCPCRCLAGWRACSHRHPQQRRPLTCERPPGGAGPNTTSSFSFFLQLLATLLSGALGQRMDAIVVATSSSPRSESRPGLLSHLFTTLARTGFCLGMSTTSADVRSRAELLSSSSLSANTSLVISGASGGATSVWSFHHSLSASASSCLGRLRLSD